MVVGLGLGPFNFGLLGRGDALLTSVGWFLCLSVWSVGRN